MKVSEILTELGYAEMQQSNIVNAAHVIEKQHYPLVLSLINAGLVELYKRFTVSIKEILIMIEPCRHIYPLTKENTLVQHQVGTEGFIIPLDEEYCGDDYLGDLKEILLVMTEDRQILRHSYTPGIKYNIHNTYGIQYGWPGRVHRNEQTPTRPAIQGCYCEEDPLSILPLNPVGGAHHHKVPPIQVSLKDYRTLKILYPQEVNLIVQYSVGFVPMVQKELHEIPNLEFHLPYEYKEALIYYVASRFFNPLGAMQIGTSQFHEGSSYYSKFEEACARLKELGLEIDNQIDTNWYPNKGFI